ncbi:hypothetical protein [Glaciihabitans sp. UYNi722]|uniref:hypothetical protein n=1 Tax=Glaciihabitans sp. UYNi722 TaxID=3156344 RepID=UPI0033991C2E
MGSGRKSDAARARAAEVIQEGKRSEFHSLGLVLGYGYGPDSAAQAPSSEIYLPQARIGNRLPHARSIDGSSLFDKLGPDFTVIGSADSSRPLLAALATRGVPAVHLDAIAAGFSAAEVPLLALVRPDQHLAWVAEESVMPDDPDLIIDAALRGFRPSASAAQ